MALKSIKRLILSKDGASIKLASVGDQSMRRTRLSVFHFSRKLSENSEITPGQITRHMEVLNNARENCLMAVASNNRSCERFFACCSGA
jgi:hypothetical protein